MKKLIAILTICLLFASQINAQIDQLESEIIKTNNGDLEIVFVGHGSLIFVYQDQYIYIDPSMRSGFAYDEMPKADLVIITHEHGDHYDPKTLEKIVTDDTKYISTQVVFDYLNKGEVMNNGDAAKVLGFDISAIPAYNIERKRSNGKPFHAKGVGNGYVFTFGMTKIYVAGDTEFIPEMKNLEDIHTAFLPMNLPYTMKPEEVANAAKSFKPRILYPYHYGKTNTQELIDLMKDQQFTEVIIKKM